MTMKNVDLLQANTKDQQLLADGTLGWVKQGYQTPYPGLDHSWMGDVVYGQAGENLAIGNLCYLKKSDNKWWKASSSYTVTCDGDLAIATGTILANAYGKMLIRGMFRDDTLAMTLGVEQYVGTASGTISVAPSYTSAAIVRSVGYAQAAGVLVFNPEPRWRYVSTVVKKAFGDVGAAYTLSKDNGGVERKFFKDDFSNDTIANYTVTGSPSIASGVLTMAYGDKIIKTLDSGATAGKKTVVFQYATAYVATAQDFVLWIGSTSLLTVRRIAGNVIQLYLNINGVNVITPNPTGLTLADSTYATVDVIYDGTNYSLYWNGTIVGSATAGGSVVSTNIGCQATITNPLSIIVNEITYSPSVAFTDPFTSDTETRYMQLSSTDGVAYAASAAGDVVVTGGKMTLSSSDDKAIQTTLRSYNFASGEYEFAFDNNNDGGGGIDSVCGVFGFQDISNYYKVMLLDNTSGAETLYFYKVVAGTTTQIGSSKDVSATYTRGNKTWIKVQWNAQTGQMWAYLRDDAGVYPTTPDISDAFSSQFSYGKSGYRATVTEAGAGNLNVDFYPMTIRANLLIGETNIPVTETGFYFRDEFSTNSDARYTHNAGTWVVAGGTYGLTVARGGAQLNSFKMTNTTTLDISVSVTMATTNENKWAALSFLMDTLQPSTAFESPNSGYRAAFGQSGGAKTISLTRYIATSSTSLGSAIPSAGEFPDAGEAHIIRVTVTSAGLITVYLDGVSKITATDTTYSNGVCGIGGYQATAGSMNFQFDNLIISGTRYYYRPMLRGAQIGAYWDGTTEVACTRFVDDFNWGTSLEYTSYGSIHAWDVANGKMTVAIPNSASASTNRSPLLGKLGYGTYTIKYAVESVSGNYLYINFCRDTIGDGSSLTRKGYFVRLQTASTGLVIRRVDSDGGGVAATSTLVGSISPAYVSGATHTLKILVTASGITVWDNDILQTTFADTTYATGYFSIGGDDAGGGAATYSIRSIEFNALESTSTNGIAVGLGGVPHGARYDTQEYAYISGTPSTLGLAGKYEEAPYCVTTYAGSTKYISNSVINSTDGTTCCLDSNDYATPTPLIPAVTYGCPIRKNIGVDLLHSSDVLRLQALLDTTAVAIDTQPATFVDGFWFRKVE